MPKKSKFTIKNIKIPGCPGIYKMIDKEGRVLYIGKAKNLKKRVSSYFRQSKDKGVRINKMIQQITDIQFITVDSELEAILLETNLIKELRPKYNILMRDDKNFVYIKINQNEDFPTLEIVRKVQKDGAKYFGPKTAKWKVEKTFDLLHKIFLFRNCQLGIFWRGDHQIDITNKVIKYPCLEYHIKRCCAPCIGLINKEEYKKMINSIIDFLNGKYEDVLEKLKEDMMQAAAEKKFEIAAKLRDQLLAVQDIMQKQKISSPDQINQDLISFVVKNAKIFFNLFMVRDGKLINQENFIFETTVLTKDSGLGGMTIDAEIYEAFIEQYYVTAADIPNEILISEDLEEKDLMEEWLSNIKNSKVKITIPQKGKKNKLLELSQRNAENFATQNQAKFELEKTRTVDAMEFLKNILTENGLKIERSLNRIECYDISHLAGTHTVGSMVVFEKGRAKNFDYRHFQLKTLKKGEIDDFKSMAEVLERRLKYLSNQWLTISQHSAEALPQRIDGQYKVRKAKKDDLKDIFKLRKAWGRQNDWIKSPEGFFVLEMENKTGKKIIGVIALLEKDKTHFEITSFLINKKYKDKSLEDLLLKRILEECPQSKVYVLCVEDAKDYYLKKGFEELNIMPKVFEGGAQICKKEYNGNCLALIYDKYKHAKDQDSSFSSKPDLIVIDGGKGQLSSAHHAMKNLNIDIPMIALAKKEEEIFFLCHSHENGNLKLSKDSPALQLLQRIRDEAHRFAITFNKHKRIKAMTHSVLDEIPGIGQEIKMQLLQNFGSIDGIKKADFQDLRAIIGENKAIVLQEYLLAKN